MSNDHLIPTVRDGAAQDAARDPAGRAETADLEQLAGIFAVLADATRLRIVGLLAAGGRSGIQVAEALGISQALACHHLSKLAQSGLVRQRREGQSKNNQLDRALLERYLAQVRAVADPRAGER